MRRLSSLISAAGIFVLCVQAAEAEKFNRACTSVPRHLWLSLQALFLWNRYDFPKPSLLFGESSLHPLEVLWSGFFDYHPFRNKVGFDREGGDAN